MVSDPANRRHSDALMRICWGRNRLVSLEDMCRDCPELLEDVPQMLARLASHGFLSREFPDDGRDAASTASEAPIAPPKSVVTAFRKSSAKGGSAGSTWPATNSCTALSPSRVPHRQRFAQPASGEAEAYLAEARVLGRAGPSQHRSGPRRRHRRQTAYATLFQSSSKAATWQCDVREDESAAWPAGRQNGWRPWPRRSTMPTEGVWSTATSSRPMS